jgi:hydrogenase maturation protease
LKALIGVGNEFRRDDGVGPALIAHVAESAPPGVTLSVVDGEPSQLLDAWDGVQLAVVVDAVLCDPSTPGRIHRTTLGEAYPAGTSASTHGLGIPDALGLAEALGRAPARLVVFAVEAADLGFGTGLSRPVAEALPDLTRLVLDELA